MDRALYPSLFWLCHNMPFISWCMFIVQSVTLGSFSCDHTSVTSVRTCKLLVTGTGADPAACVYCVLLKTRWRQTEAYLALWIRVCGAVVCRVVITAKNQQWNVFLSCMCLHSVTIMRSALESTSACVYLLPTTGYLLAPSPRAKQRSRLLKSLLK